MSAQEYPLARDAEGIPLAVPPEAVHWRVMRDSTGGRPGAVFDPATGQRLKIPIDATVADLIKCGCAPGRYRLEALSADGRALPVLAFVDVVEPASSSGGPPAAMNVADAFTVLVQLVVRSMDTNCRAMEAMASAFGPVRPAAAPPPPVLVEAAPRDESMKPEAFMQMLTTLVTQGVEALKAIKAGAAS
jgi:hypothetical protein